ncbi:MAG: hypothetical protein C0595_03390 [Marinilabiliales bacterium]|nr:MAG: hypothetical protein C0595_03390 [Marinilabiliales bacterium]
MRFNLKRKRFCIISKIFNPGYLFRISVLFLIYLASFSFNNGFSQTSENNLVNFSVDNIPISSALYQLSLQCGYDISYDASDSSLQQLISISARDELALDIYRKLLQNTNHSFKQIDNLIVVFSPGDKVEDSLNSEDESSYLLAVENSVIPDTVFISDTIFRTKTDTLLITRTDTLRIVDTVFIVKPGRDKIKQIKKNNNELITKKVPRKNGWSGEFFVSPMASTFSLSEENSPLKFRNFSIGADLTKIIDNLNISVGIKLNHFADNYNNEYLIQEGGYYQTDTLDIYYTIQDADTSWYYVTDSSWLPVDNHQYNYNIKNRIGYFDIGLSATYDFYSIGKSRIFAGLGLNSGFLIYRSGTAIRNKDTEPQGVNFADLEFDNVVFSAQAKIGLKYQINKIVDFKTELYYFQSFDDAVSNFPYNNKLNGVGLKFALLYYF